MSTVRERLKQYISSKDMSVRKFEASINASFSYVNSISRSIGIDKLESIVDKYPDLNLKWLLTGKGEMTESTENDRLKSLTETNILEMLDILIDNNTEFLKNPEYEQFIRNNIKYLQTEDLKEETNKEMLRLKELIINKTKQH